jgi:hypothetical protein
MGNLFPEDEYAEYPDHRPIPLSWPIAKGSAIVAGIGIAVTANDQLPWSNPQPDPPHREYVQIQTVLSVPGSGLSSVDPLTWQNSSMFEAAHVAIRAAHARRSAQSRIAMFSTSSSWMPST